MCFEACFCALLRCVRTNHLGCVRRLKSGLHGPPIRIANWKVVPNETVRHGGEGYLRNVHTPRKTPANSCHSSCTNERRWAAATVSFI